METRFIKGNSFWRIFIALCLVVSTLWVTAIPASAAVTITLNPNLSSTAGETTVVTITGTGSAWYDGCKVKFDTTWSNTVTFIDATHMTAVAPAHAATGTTGINVAVYSSDGLTALSGNKKFNYYVQPTVTGISPNSGLISGGTAVTITGTDFPTTPPNGTIVTFGGTAAASYTINSATSITTTTPAHAVGLVDVSVILGGSQASLTGTLTGGFTYYAVPAVSALSPSAGPLAGGTSVTISGTGFTGATAVTFGATPATSVTVDSDTQIRAISPSGSGTADVTVTNPVGTSPLNPPYDHFAYSSVITVSSISPAGGPLEGGETVTITGANFVATPTVTIGGTSCTSVTLVDSSHFTAITPSGTGTLLDVVVTNPDFTSATLAGVFTYYDVPTVTSILPASGPTPGGTAVLITGTNFYDSPAVTIGGVTCTGIIVDNATAISAITPAHGTVEAVDVTVTTFGGHAATLSGGFTYTLPVPTITSCTPNNGSQSGGKVTTITGTNFFAPATVTFDGDTATVTSVTTTQIICTTPSYSPGVHVAATVPVVVTCNGLTSAPVNAYTYNLNPVIYSVSPSVGPTAGGTTVTISGANFTASPNALTFGGATYPATNIALLDNATITAKTPAHAAGSVSVAVSIKGTSATLANGFLYSDSTAPVVSGIVPNVGSPDGGTLVTINGANFVAGGTTVTFDGNTAAISSVTTTQIVCTAPAHAEGIVTVTVNTSSGSGTGSFNYTNAIAISSINPAAGPVAGGQPVTIIGANFVSGITVKIGLNSCTDVVFDNSTYITAVTPSGTGTQDVTVTNPDLTYAILVGGFTFYNPPTVTSILPVSGSIGGGTAVTITGTNFYSPAKVTIGDNFTTGLIIVDNSTQIRATTPAGTAGASNVVVTTNSGSSDALTGGFTYTVTPPTVTSCNPPNGSQSGGKVTTITGMNFFNISDLRVTFDGDPATSITVADNHTQIVCTTPNYSPGVHAPVAVAVVVTCNGLSSTPVSAYTYLVNPTVTGVSPTFGPTTGATSVTIIGADFANPPNAVTFGGTAATSFTWVDANHINAVTPAHAAGAVIVSVAQKGCLGTLNNGFYYTDNATPVVTSISPISGPVGGGFPVTINGRFFDNSASAVNFGSNSASFSVVSGTEIIATVPGGSGTVDVTVTTAAGTSDTSSADQFTYLAPPTVDGISPSSGPEIGGSTVTITGTNLTGATIVSFGGSPATAFTVNSDDNITATAPAGTGTQDVRVTTAGGISDTSSADQFTYKPAPTVNGLSISSGPATGGTAVIITGTNFLYGASKVSFGSADASFIVDSDTQITATSPAGTGTVNVTVTTEGGVSVTSSADQFTYIPAPTVSAISPVSGPITGSTSVTITGTNFTGATTVSFGSTAATSFSVDSPTQITAISPAGSVGTVDVTVTTAGGTSAISAADQFTYVGANVNITVTLQGGSRPDAGFVVPLTVKFFTPGTNVLTGTPTYTFELTTAKSGTFTAVATAIGVLPGTYDISAVTPTCLINEKKNVVVDAPSTNVNLGTLLEGDAITSGSSANVVNSQDFGALAASYNKSLGQSGYNDAADFDRTGKVNSQDFGLLAANYNKKGPVVLP